MRVKTGLTNIKKRTNYQYEKRKLLAIILSKRKMHIANQILMTKTVENLLKIVCITWPK